MTLIGSTADGLLHWLYTCISSTFNYLHFCILVLLSPQNPKTFHTTQWNRAIFLGQREYRKYYFFRIVRWQSSKYRVGIYIYRYMNQEHGTVVTRSCIVFFMIQWELIEEWSKETKKNKTHSIPSVVDVTHDKPHGWYGCRVYMTFHYYCEQ